MIVVDTHVFVWLAEDSRRLGAKARRRVKREIGHGRVLVSAITYWEIAMLAEAGRLRLRADLASVRAAAERSGPTEIPVDGEIGIVAARLANLHGDPADRIVVATALCRRATLMTADDRLLSMQGGPACIDAAQ